MYINAVQSYFSPPIGAVYLLAVLWKRSNEKVSFIHFSPLFHFYTLKTSKNQKGFLTFPGGIEMEHWAKMSYQKNATDFRGLQTVKCRSPKVIYCYQRRIQNLVKHLRQSFFCENSQRFSFVNYFLKKTLSQMFDWHLNAHLVLYYKHHLLAFNSAKHAL